MSFVNELAFKEKVGDFEIIGNLEVGGNILLDGEIPKVNQMMALKTDVATTNSLTSVVNLKVNQSEMDAMETAINATLDTKATQTAVDTSLALKANQSDVDAQFVLTGQQTDSLSTALLTKANTTDVDTAMALKANTTDMATALDLKADQVDVDNMATQANLTDVSTALDLKANQSDVDTALALKANQTNLSVNTARIGVDGRLDIRSINTQYGSETVTLQTVIEDNDIGGYTDDNRNLMALQPYAGRVGIGTTTPVRSLDVRSGLTSTSANWISGVFGGTQTSSERVVMGNLLGDAVVGSHSSALDDWTDLYLNAPTHNVVVKANGRVGMGAPDPEEKLHVSGNIKASGHVEATELLSPSLYWGGKNYATYTYQGFLSYTFRRLVGQRFNGMICFNPVSNDHSGAVFHVAENSDGASGSIVVTRRKTNYYNSGKYINYRWNGGWLEFYGEGMNLYQYYNVTIFGSIN